MEESLLGTTNYFGNNTIGAPSMLAYKKEIDEKFDKNLRHLIDCDLYFIFKNKKGIRFIQNILLCKTP